jgi:hypothetical protein
MFTIGIRIPTDNYNSFFGEMIGRTNKTAQEWRLFTTALRLFKGSIDVSDPACRDMYDLLSPSFPLFSGTPPPGHPHPAAFLDPDLDSWLRLVIASDSLPRFPKPAGRSEASRRRPKSF